MSDTLATLAAESDKIHTEYRRNFAGKSRFTRDLALLDRLLGQTQDLSTRAAATPGSDTELAPVLRQRLDVYQSERGIISQLQAGGADEAVAHRTGTWARLLLQRYGRNFAGQNRLTRDEGLLQELVEIQRRMIDELRAAATRHDPDWHADDLAFMQRNIQLFEGELPQIHTARAALEPGRRAQVLGTLANNQFNAWRVHFQGRPRRSRRPALLRRMVASLERVHADMLAAQQAGATEDFVQRNLDIVAERLTAWKPEIGVVDQARGQVGPDAVVGALGEDANTWFARFRKDFTGKRLADLDVDGLAEICEGLSEVGLAMEDHATTWRRPLNAQNLEVVMENLKAYERELERAKEAHKSD